MLRPTSHRRRALEQVNQFKRGCIESATIDCRILVDGVGRDAATKKACAASIAVIHGLDKDEAAELEKNMVDCRLWNNACTAGGLSYSPTWKCMEESIVAAIRSLDDLDNDPDQCDKDDARVNLIAFGFLAGDFIPKEPTSSRNQIFRFATRPYTIRLGWRLVELREGLKIFLEGSTNPAVDGSACTNLAAKSLASQDNPAAVKATGIECTRKLATKSIAAQDDPAADKSCKLATKSIAAQDNPTASKSTRKHATKSLATQDDPAADKSCKLATKSIAAQDNPTASKSTRKHATKSLATQDDPAADKSSSDITDEEDRAGPSNKSLERICIKNDKLLVRASEAMTTLTTTMEDLKMNQHDLALIRN